MGQHLFIQLSTWLLLICQITHTFIQRFYLCLICATHIHTHTLTHSHSILAQVDFRRVHSRSQGSNHPPSTGYSNNSSVCFSCFCFLGRIQTTCPLLATMTCSCSTLDCFPFFYFLFATYISIFSSS